MITIFTNAEVEYLKSQPLGRLATVGANGMPHVAPVGVFYDPDTQAIVVGSTGDMTASKKFRDVQRHPEAAFLVDDLASVDPWTPRGIEIRGHAETFSEGGEEIGKKLNAPFPFDAAWIRLRPRRVVAWGLDTGAFEATGRDVA